MREGKLNLFKKKLWIDHFSNIIPLRCLGCYFYSLVQISTHYLKDKIDCNNREKMTYRSMKRSTLILQKWPRTNSPSLPSPSASSAPFLESGRIFIGSHSEAFRVPGQEKATFTPWVKHKHTTFHRLSRLHTDFIVPINFRLWCFLLPVFCTLFFVDVFSGVSVHAFSVGAFSRATFTSCFRE